MQIPPRSVGLSIAGWCTSVTMALAEPWEHIRDIAAAGKEQATPIVAATAESFREVGDPILVVFSRDKTGNVAGHVMHFPDGQLLRARKLP